MFDKHRQRRVIYNDDADQRYHQFSASYGYDITDEQSFVNARTTPTFNTHVDTYVWCVGNGADPPWGAVGHNVHPCLGSNERAADVIVEACHAQGLEVWGSLRMNDIHDSFMAASLAETSEPIKAEHPEYLLAPESNRDLPRELIEQHLWSALNFARPEVRRHRLDYVERNATAHDFDGYELDFTRFVWCFPPGQERECAPLMTDLIRQARVRLNAIGARRQRPYTFAVHVLDSPEVSLNLGLDVEAWLQEGLIDVLVVGLGYMPYVLRLDEWLALGRRYGVPVYPSVNTNTYTDWWKEHFQSVAAFQHAVRASSAYFWQQGADGLYLFNLFCQEDRRLGTMSADDLYRPLNEIGDPSLLTGLDKLYGIQPTADSGFCQQGSEAAPLPIVLDQVERKLPLHVGPDGGDPHAQWTLHILTTGGSDIAPVWVRLNHALLPEPTRDGQWYRLSVPSGVLRPGSNQLTIWCQADATATADPLIVHRVFAAAAYGSTPTA